jgi:GTP-binding protein
MSAPVVAIIGRPNVGKSTFFNRVLGERRAVVHDRPGVTRDRNAVRAEWAGRHFLLVDTGGFLPTALEGRDAEVRKQAETAIGLAHAVVFMVDAHTGVTDLDAAIAQNLRKRGANALLVVNKVDKPGDPIVHEFHRLGLGEPIAIAAEGGLGIGDLLDRVTGLLPRGGAVEPEARGRIAIIGRPNVGKSSIVNALLGEPRMVVDAVAGTTVDAIDATWRTEAGDFVLVDTAGIRRESHYPDENEFFATVRALNALERADVAGLVVDATEGFHKQEARLVHSAFDAGCSVLLLYNKWDLIEEREAKWKAQTAELERRFPTLAGLPAMPISALTRLHLHRLATVLHQRVEEHRRTVPTRELNAWLEAVQRKRQVPSNAVGKAPRIYYVTQTGTRPPEFTLFVNAPSRLNANYRRYLWLQLVDRFGFHGTPVRLRVRKSE